MEVPMNRKVSGLAVALAAAALVLAGCAGPASDSGGSEDSGGTTSASPSPSETTPEESTEGSADLMVAASSLGDIVVDGKGMTVYVFDNDTAGSGTSSCSGQCLVNWPPVPPSGDEPTADGVTGELGTITATDGSTQITLNGFPLYYWKGDAAPGDVTGQAVQEVWWVVSPTGEAIH
jgi:predicted lipoprotein with Yx(FWY)xxD motif